MNRNQYIILISLTLKDQKEHIICTMDDVRRDVLGPPHDTTPATVIASSFKSSDDLKRKKMDHTAVSDIESASVTL